MKLFLFNSPLEVKKYLVGSLYRPLSNNSNEFNLEQQKLILLKVQTNFRNFDVLISVDTSLKLFRDHSSPIDEYMNIFHSFGLVPQNLWATRVTSKLFSLFDHIITINEENIRGWTGHLDVRWQYNFLYFCNFKKMLFFIETREKKTIIVFIVLWAGHGRAN